MSYGCPHNLIFRMQSYPIAYSSFHSSTLFKITFSCAMNCPYLLCPFLPLLFMAISRLLPDYYKGRTIAHHKWAILNHSSREQILYTKRAIIKR